MNGPEHYEEAQRLISMVEKTMPGGQFRHFDGDEDTRAMLAAAQVHATLALFPMVREIGDQLDTDPRREPVDNLDRRIAADCLVSALDHLSTTTTQEIDGVDVISAVAVRDLLAKYGREVSR